MTYGKLFTVCVNFESGQLPLLLNCISSIYDAKEFPAQLILTSRHNDLPDEIFDIVEFRSFDLIKTTGLSLNKIRNIATLICNTEYIIFTRDDTTLNDDKYLEKIYSLLNEDTLTVNNKLTIAQLGHEWSSFASHIDTIYDGFDAGLSGKHFEEIDIRERINTNKEFIQKDLILFNFLNKNRFLNDKSLITKNYNYLCEKWGKRI